MDFSNLRKSLGICLCMFLLFSKTNAQHSLSTQIQKELSTKQPTHYGLFTINNERSAVIDKDIDHVTYLTLNKSELNNLMLGMQNLISLSLPVENGKEISLQLMSYDFHTSDFRTVLKTGSGFERTPDIAGRYFRGALKGQEISMAAFSFFEDEIGAVFSDLENGNYNLVLNKANPGKDNENYILYKENDIIRKDKRGSCGLTADMEALTGPGTGSTPAGKGIYKSCNSVRISILADYHLYRRCSSSMVKSVQYVNTLFNVISALYANDNLPLSLSETVVSSIDEGYDYSSSDKVLIHFGNLIQKYPYNGDIAHFLTGYYHPVSMSPPLGGLAWLDVLCIPATPAFIGDDSTFYGPYSMGNVFVSPTIPALPTYSWDVEVTAHELGHNIGSPHTQSCTWPGGAIDNCFPTEGGCSPGLAPVGGGTIMSYCHLTPSIGINFANGFGPLPSALLLDNIITKPCVRSGLPESTIEEISKVITANAECSDGTFTHYFFDNNTSDLSDDVMLLSVDKRGQNIGNTSNADFLIRMTTNSYYAKDTVPNIIVAYADTNWHQINRTWTIQLPAGKQPTSAVVARYPYTMQDVADIRKVLLPKVIDDTSLIFLKYANKNPVTSPATAVYADVRRVKNGSSGTAITWAAGAEIKYKYAEITLDSGIYGGTLGYQTAIKLIDTPTSLKDFGKNQKLNIVPNPASNTISIIAPLNNSDIQQVFVYDNLGRIVYQSKSQFVNSTLKLEISTLSNGVYTIKCYNEQDGKMLNGLFIKQ